MALTTQNPQLCDCQRQQFDCLACIDQWVLGNEDALDPLVHKFQPIVQKIVSNRLGHEREDEWEDCNQTIWERLFSPGHRQGTDSAQDASSTTSRLGNWLAREDRGWFCWWLFQVTARRSIDWVRPRGWTEELKHLEKLVRYIARRDDSVQDPIWDEIRSQIDETLTTTTLPTQQFFQLYYEQSISLKETCTQLADAHGTTEPEIRKIRKDLLERLRHCVPLSLQHPGSSKSVPLETVDPALENSSHSLDDLVANETRTAVERLRETLPPSWNLIFQGRYQDQPQKPWAEILIEINHLRAQEEKRPISDRTMHNWHSELLDKLEACF